MSQDKRRRFGPQSLNLPSLEELERSPNWRRIRDIYERLYRLRDRGLLPEFSPEMVEKLRQTQAGLEETMAVREARERRQRELDEEQHEGEEGQRRVEEQRRIEELRRVEEERHRLKAERVEHEAELRRYGQGEASLHYPVPAIRWGWKYEQTNEEQQRGGRPSFRPPHLEMALNAMAEKWPKARHSKTDKRQIEFVSDLCRKRGDEIGCIYNNDGSVFDKALEQAFRRRIDEWKNPRKRWRLRFCSGA